jgi:hypothetical protein
MGGVCVRRLRSSESGVALVLALMALMVVSAVGAAVVLLAVVETRLMASEHVRLMGRGLAEVQLERALQDLAREPDWDAVLSGAASSSFFGSTETPEVAGWGVLDLRGQTMALQAEVGSEWGLDAPRWRLYAHGVASDLVGAAAGGGPPAYAGFYTAVWVADDEGDGDGRAMVDRNGVIAVRAEAFGPSAARQVWLATVRRSGSGIELLSLRGPP